MDAALSSSTERLLRVQSPAEAFSFIFANARNQIQAARPADIYCTTVESCVFISSQVLGGSLSSMCASTP
ncbi:hypothetical protein MVEN_01103600 [Mycena venus]|uniref:Uncharacterized protein n=1 Tax=Mycena venus TaxID=2733690 RepID=A0A8H7CXP9_9AGAR|nr:hypothetical protein MVEN_01103600 [Mycena venus]